jgi:hypothetical protein
MDPAPDPPIFVTDLQEANKKLSAGIWGLYPLHRETRGKDGAGRDEVRTQIRRQPESLSLFQYTIFPLGTLGNLFYY